MADPQQSLAHPFVLGFVGDEAVHPANAKALLMDFIGVHLRQNKGAEIRFVLPADPFTDTMDELAELAYSSRYQLDIVTHDDLPERWVGQAGAITVSDEVPLWGGVVARLVGEPSARLILVADPNVDDVAYGAALNATERNVKTRSLLAGLDTVIFRPEEQPEEERVEMPPNFDEEEFDDEFEDDAEDADAEDAEVEDDAEDTEDEGGEETEGDDADAEEEEDEDEEADDAVAEEAPPAPVRRTVKKAAKKTTKKAKTTGPPVYTQRSLEQIVTEDKQEFLVIARSFGVEPGKGIKIATMISRILEAQESGQPYHKPPATKKAPPVKKVAAAKKVARRPEAPTTKAAANSHSGLPSAELKAAIRAAKAFLDLVDAMV